MTRSPNIIVWKTSCAVEVVLRRTPQPRGVLFDVGTSGGYWSSTVAGVGARGFTFDSGGAVACSLGRAYGLSVRCIKN